MAFGTRTNQPTGGDRPQVDFDALNKYVVETAALQQRETLVGIVSMLVDLGEQEQEDAEVKFTGTEEDEMQEIAKNPNTYFKDGFDQETKKPARMKCWPQKPVQCVAIAVDFPDILIDKGQFFGESKPLPLRIWMGGQFYLPGTGMIVGKMLPLKWANLDKTRQTKKFSLAQTNTLYKMALGAKIIQPGEVFEPTRIDELLGKALQFDAQIFFKESKGKQYYTEYVKFASGLGRGQAVPELPFEPMMIQFNEENPDEAIKDLRAHVVNTIKRALDYDNSLIKEQIERVRGTRQEGGDAPAKAETPQRNTPAPAPQPAAADDSFDDDIPFAPIGLQEGKFFLHMI